VRAGVSSGRGFGPYEAKACQGKQLRWSEWVVAGGAQFPRAFGRRALGIGREADSPGLARAGTRIQARGRAGPRRGGSRTHSGGRGGAAAAGFRARALAQRVAIKARVVKTGGGRKAGASLRGHLRYIRGREDELKPALQRTPGGLFGAQGALAPDDVEALARKMEGDRHNFRFIVSPEAGAELDLKDYTADLVAHLEQDLGMKLEWVAGEHRDTDNPHIHLRGCCGGPGISTRGGPAATGNRHLGSDRTDS